MARSGELPETRVSDDDESNLYFRNTTPRENFDIKDSQDQHTSNGFLKQRKTNKTTLWSQLYRMALRKNSHKPSVYDDGDEDEDLLNDDTPKYASGIKKDGGIAYRRRTFGFWKLLALCCILWTLYTLTYMFFDPLHQRPNPLEGWGNVGTSSEGLDWYPTDFLRDVLPVPCHSHNDYWRTVPLFSALYAGCTGIEADVWNFDTGVLYVGHNTAALTANRTFGSLYINPLVKILERQNPSTEFYHGSNHGVFDTDHEQSVTLLVDVKTDGATTWPIVLQQLQPLREKGWLTYVENDVLHPRPITVVGTGETPFDVLTSNQSYRDAFFDSPLDTMWSAPDLLPENAEDSNGESSERQRDTGPDKIQLGNSAQGSAGTSPSDDYNPLNSYYASTSFIQTVGRVPWGKLSAKQLNLIRGRIKGAHEKGLRVRYWDTPQWPRSLRNYIWDTLIKEGADILNVDDLKDASQGVW